MADNNEYFFKQRRNLNIMSLLFAFYTLGEMQFKNNEVNIVGSTITIAHPMAITFGLWLFFFYFLWRYYTYCNEIEGVTKFMALRNRKIVDFCKLYTVRNIAKLTGFAAKELEVEIQSHGQAWSVPIRELSYSMSVYQPVHTQWKIDNQKKLERLHHCSKGEVKPMVLLCLKCLGTLNIALHQNDFSEYILPYLLAWITFVLACGRMLSKVF